VGAIDHRVFNKFHEFIKSIEHMLTRYSGEVGAEVPPHAESSGQTQLFGEPSHGKKSLILEKSDKVASCPLLPRENVTMRRA
jgi:hypothetical protein